MSVLDERMRRIARDEFTGMSTGTDTAPADINTERTAELEKQVADLTARVAELEKAAAPPAATKRSPRKTAETSE